MTITKTTERGTGIACYHGMHDACRPDLWGPCSCPCHAPAPARQRWTFAGRRPGSLGDHYMWHRRDGAGKLIDAWASPVAAMLDGRQ